MDYATHTEALSLVYQGKLALDDMTLALPRGGIHAVIGANGAGKSSLFRVLLGFESPTAGRAAVLGCDSTALTPELRGRIGFVNEEHTLPGWLRVSDACNMQRKLYQRWNQSRFEEVVGNFNILPGQYIAQLSRGERAGVSLALALAQNPELLILDEPTLGLDVVAKRAFLESLLFTALDSDATVVYCSHQLEEVERVADNLVIIERGRLRHMSAPDELCGRVRLWVAEFPFKAPDLRALPGLLEVQQIDGLTHLTVFGQPDEFETRLKLMGARTVHSMPATLERAVNGFLSRGHAAAKRAA